MILSFVKFYFHQTLICSSSLWVEETFRHALYLNLSAAFLHHKPPSRIMLPHRENHSSPVSTLQEPTQSRQYITLNPHIPKSNVQKSKQAYHASPYLPKHTTTKMKPSPFSRNFLYLAKKFSLDREVSLFSFRFKRMISPRCCVWAPRLVFKRP